MKTNQVTNDEDWIMREYVIAGITALSLFTLAAGCVPPPRVAGQPEPAVGEERASGIDPLFLPPSPETIPGTGAKNLGANQFLNISQSHLRPPRGRLRKFAQTHPFDPEP